MFTESVGVFQYAVMLPKGLNPDRKKIYTGQNIFLRILEFTVYLLTVADVLQISEMSSKGFKPDRGWAWVILITALLCNVVFDGILYSFGVFYVEFLDYFGEGVTKTSWIGSTVGAVYLCTGRYSGIKKKKVFLMVHFC